MGRAVIRMTNPGVGFPCSTKRDGELIGLPREEGWPTCLFIQPDDLCVWINEETSVCGIDGLADTAC